MNQANIYWTFINMIKRVDQDVDCTYVIVERLIYSLSSC